MTIDYNFNVWDETYDPVFSEICKQSRLPEKWISYRKNTKTKYANSLIKPVNSYVESLYPAPKLVSIEGNVVRLRQHNHAEFFLLEKKQGVFYNLDRPWMRQYYKTKDHPEKIDGYFNNTYKFYTPWVVDADVFISIEQPTVQSPFLIYPKAIERSLLRDNQEYLEPDFVAFKFKRTGPHMVNDKFGKIKLDTPMFDIVFEGSGIIIQRVKDFYEQH